MSDEEDPDLEEDEEEEVTVQPRESGVLTEVRRKLRQAQKDLKAKDALIEELSPFKAQVEAVKLRGAFTEAGLNEKHADLFRAVKPQAEVNAETIKAFAEEYGLATGASEGQKPEQVFPAPVRGEPASRTLTWDEYQEKLRSPETHLEAMKARKAGLVDESTYH